jgi:Icc protein
MDENQRERSELHKALQGTGERPDPSLRITRRTFLHKSLMTGAAGAATYGWFPLIGTLDFVVGQAGQQATAFKFAWISDNHLYPRDVNTRFVDKAVRAVKEVQAMKPAADFLIHGGDLAQLADPVELDLGNEILKEVKIRKVFIPGEHDWYLDMGQKWTNLFGQPNWTFDHKGVRFVGLDTVSRGPDYWTAKKMTPKERMGHMATLDGSVAGAWAGVGRDQLEWLNRTLSNWPKDRPVVIFSHNPLYEYYPPWNFWVRDWREVHEVLRPYSNVTNIHGHTHQVLYNEIGKLRSIGMLATSWTWPYAPEGVPALTKCKVRVDPGDHFDGVGYSRLTLTAANRIENEYVMWRKDVFAEAPYDSGCADNVNQNLHPRIADQEWPYYGAYK